MHVRVGLCSNETHHSEDGGVKITEVEVKGSEVRYVWGKEIGAGGVSGVKNGVNACAEHEGKG